MQDQTPATIRIVNDIAEIPADAWNALANPDQATFDPFLSHAFLKALEEAGTTGRRAGWLPYHLVLEGPDGAIAGVCPAYIKSHSQGEYVFDWSWADAYERAGGRYYPKLQVAVPFTPVPGRRLLAAPGPEQAANEARLADGIEALTEKLGLSSAHITFLTEQQWQRLGAMNYLQRTGKQYHFENDGYRTFDDFLATLSSRKRKNLRKERQAALSGDLEIEWVTGSDLTEAHWDAFYEFYIDTGSRKWGHPYLNREFFSLLGAAMPDHCLLVLVRRNGRYVAGALNMIGGECLYGRYWGCIEHHPFLHFEVCYYQAIDFAIARGLKRVEAGAGGDHKIARGYEPVATYSAHWIEDPGFRKAVARFLDDEREQMERLRSALATATPYRKADPES
ncbi:MAG: hypothetical protein RLZ98_128 [Pseudomonadota bacterium]|jgi:predicted N-acyltransferase